MISIRDMNYSVDTLPIQRQHHVAAVDEDGNRLFDRGGRPIYRQVDREDNQQVYKPNYLVEFEGETKWMTEKQIKNAFSPRQLRIAIKEWRRTNG